MENSQRHFHLLIKRFLEGTASLAEREEVNRLLETDVIDEIMQNELTMLQRKDRDNPFHLYKTGNFGAMRSILEEDRITRERLRKISISEDDIIEEIIHFRDHDEGVRGVWIYRAVAAVLIVSLAIGLFRFRSGLDHIGSTDFPSGQSVWLNTKQSYVLPDGSVVYVNSHSTACYEKNGAREVTLTGEAYFDVAHDSHAPFIIHAGGIEVKVLGTGFNVRVDSAHHAVVVTVARGMVEVGRGAEVFDLVRPREELTVDFDSYRHEIKTISPDAEIKWFWREIMQDGATRDSVAKPDDIITPTGGIRSVDTVAALILRCGLETKKKDK